MVWSSRGINEIPSTEGLTRDATKCEETPMDWFALGFFLVLVLGDFLYVTPRLWRSDKTMLQKFRQHLRPMWWFGEHSFWRAVAASPVMSVAGVLFAAGAVVLVVARPTASEPSAPAALAMKLLVSLGAISTGLALSIALLFRPKFLIPPKMRNEQTRQKLGLP